MKVDNAEIIDYWNAHDEERQRIVEELKDACYDAMTKIGVFDKFGVMSEPTIFALKTMMDGIAMGYYYSGKEQGLYDNTTS